MRTVLGIIRVSTRGEGEVRTYRGRSPELGRFTVALRLRSCRASGACAAKLGLWAGSTDGGEQAGGCQGVEGGLASLESTGRGRRGSGLQTKNRRILEAEEKWGLWEKIEGERVL